MSRYTPRRHLNMDVINKDVFAGASQITPIIKEDFEGIKAAEERVKRNPHYVDSGGLFDDRLVNSMIQGAAEDIVHGDKSVAERKKLVEDYAEAKKAWITSRVSGEVERIPETNDDDPEDHSDDYEESIKEKQRLAFKGKNSKWGQMKRRVRDIRREMKALDKEPSMQRFNNKKISDGMQLNENISQKAMGNIKHYNDIMKASRDEGSSKKHSKKK